MRRLLLSCLMVGFAAAGVVTPGILGWWPLDGTRNDVSGNGWTTGLVGSPTVITGIFGNCDSFDGNDADTVGHIDCNTALTVCAWIRASTTIGTQSIFTNCSAGGGGLDYLLELNRPAAGKLGFWWGNVELLQSKATLEANTWYHVVGIRSGVTSNWTASIYVNGALDTIKTGITTNPNASNVLTAIGRLGGCNVMYFKGRIEDVRLYGRALSVRDIQRVMMGMSPIE